MEVISEIQALRRFISEKKSNKNSIGFIATMGALHNGHLKLVETSQSQNDISICSIFINPTQFNNPADLQDYPRETEKDLDRLRELNCDLVFLPSESQMYEKEPTVHLNFGHLEDVMEGEYRPGHFKGVGLIVAKLLNLVQPTRAYFGTKDLQQLVLVSRLVSELFFDCEVVPVETVREKDGLAMSSRNLLLSKEDRPHAADLYVALNQARDKLINGESVKTVNDFVRDFFKSESKIDLEYFEVVHSDDVKKADQFRKGDDLFLCIAGHLGKVRLIDNISLI